MNNKKRLPVDVSSFKKIIEGGYVYVDKTKTIHHLITQRRLYFLSRPRRFGKTLLISTLKELFSGNKKLFENTWIGSHTDFQWQEHPIIHLDFSTLDIDTSEEFKISLARKLDIIAKSYSIDLSADPSPGLKLYTLATELAQRNSVVILIDEYDYPLLSTLSTPHIAKAIHKAMRNFFAVIKSLDEYLHNVFMTGVTKFAKTSIFSGMNNLNDITMSPEAASLLGYTKEEIEHYFQDYIHDVSQEQKKPITAIIDELQTWYNGYQFSKHPTKVYNPLSVLRCLDKKEFNNYWFETGTPSFLIELIKSQYAQITHLESIELDSDMLSAFEIESIRIIPILFQTGYLTIQKYNEEKRSYILHYPNHEVSDSFNKYLIAALTQNNIENISQLINQFKTALTKNDIESFCTTLKSLFASIPYQIHQKNEAYYHSLLHVLVDLLGYKAQSEVSSSKGRIDLVLHTNRCIYIFELKFMGTGKEALEQIIANRYYEKFTRFKIPIILVGLSFNIKQKELFLDWVKQEL